MSWKSPMGWPELLALVHSCGTTASMHAAMMPSGPRPDRALVIEAGHQHRTPSPTFQARCLRHFAIVEEQRVGVGAAHAEFVEMLPVRETASPSRR